MTDLVAAPPEPTTLRDAAARGAATAGVDIRIVTDLAALADVERLWSSTWHPGTDKSPASRDLMRAMTHAGSYLGAAYDGERLVGASFAFFGSPGHRHLHSHLAAVVTDAQGRNVGLALKLHQRAWALDQGVAEVTWTFDPLVRRNAHFNLAKLGAVATAYLSDFYGEMAGINAGQGSDRLLMSWPVVERVVPGPGALAPTVGEHVLVEDASGRPVSRRGAAGGPVLVQVPPDIERLRVSHLRLARTWRSAVRDVLGGLMSEGARVVGFTQDGSYVVETRGTNGETTLMETALMETTL